MSTEANSTLEKQVLRALDDVRPYLHADGGDVELIDITSENIVRIRLLGNCKDCHISEMTMKAGIEESIKSAVPSIKGVKEVKST